MQVFDGDFNQVFNKHLSEFLPYLQIPVLWIKQVLDLFLVYLVEGDMNFPVEQRTFLTLWHLFLEKPEDEVKGGWDHTLGIETDLVQNTHWISLTRACLSVHKVASVITV